MASSKGWSTRPLKDCAVWYSGGTPNKSTPRYWGGTIPWISAKSITGFFIADSEDRVTDEGARNGTRLMPTNTILFIVRGMSLKSEFRMGITTRPVTFNQDLKALVAVEDVVPAFLAYAIKARTDEILGLVGEAGHGTGVLPTDRIQSLEIPIPPLPEQRAIAHVLGTIDDKIELNQQTNDTLESMARALFKSWFVDFDPVRAKSEGRQPSGMDGETAKMFPSEFVESELGRIPKGWRVGTIGDLIAIHDAKRIPLSAREREQRRGRYPYHGATSVMDHIDGFLFDGTFVLVGEDGSVVTEAGLPFTQYVWGQFWVNNHAHVLSGLGGMSQEHLFLLLSQTNITAFVTGAVQAKLSQGNLRRIPTVVPPPAVSVRFGSAHADLFARFRSNVEETRTLARARDELLPRLLSGELSVANAASAMEAIA